MRIWQRDDGGRITNNVPRTIVGSELFCRKHRETLIRDGVLHVLLRESGWVHHRYAGDARLGSAASIWNRSRRIRSRRSPTCCCWPLACPSRGSTAGSLQTSGGRLWGSGVRHGSPRTLFATSRRELRGHAQRFGGLMMPSGSARAPRHFERRLLSMRSATRYLLWVFVFSVPWGISMPFQASAQSAACFGIGRLSAPALLTTVMEGRLRKPRRDLLVRAGVHACRARCRCSGRSLR